MRVVQVESTVRLRLPADSAISMLVREDVESAGSGQVIFDGAGACLTYIYILLDHLVDSSSTLS